MQCTEINGNPTVTIRLCAARHRKAVTGGADFIAADKCRHCNIGKKAAESIVVPEKPNPKEILASKACIGRDVQRKCRLANSKGTA